MIELIKNGTITSAKGFVAGGISAGIKISSENNLDLGIVKSKNLSNTAATFTSNKVVSPSVTVSKEKIALGNSAQAIIVNSGCANCCVGNQGYLDAQEMCDLVSTHHSISSENVFVASTGMIGVELPMALIRNHVGNIKLTEDGGHDFAKSIMTTDTRRKEIAVSFELDGSRVTIGAVAKGVGMIHPNMATMLCFIATDANVESGFLQTSLKSSVDTSFNMIDVDGDQSTNDSVFVMANGASGTSEINKDSIAANDFQDALSYVCIQLAKELVKDGEGAQRLLQVTIEGADSLKDARKGARSVVGSLLVKSMVHGGDPNWGRIMMALGKSEIKVIESEIDIFLNDIHIVHKGVSIPFLKEAVVSAMRVEEVNFKININQGNFSATAWGCDMTEEYVIFNSAYST